MQTFVGGDRRALCAEGVMQRIVLYAASRHDAPASEFWPVIMDREVMAGTPPGSFELDVRDERGMMAAASFSRLRVQAQRVSRVRHEVERDDFSGRFVGDWCRRQPEEN